jgi:hypothetical protein
VKTVNLYRIEITEPCDVTGILSNLFGGFYPFIENDMNVKKNWGSIPAGVQGWIVKKWGRKYFSPDENQPGIELFTPTDQPYVLIPYEKIKNSYKKI